MLVGTIINLFVMLPVFVVPHGSNILYMILSALIGVAGQAFITMGYHYVTSKTGSILSTVRILYAAIMGTIIFHEALSVRIALGGVLVITSIVMVTLLSGSGGKKRPLLL